MRIFGNSIVRFFLSIVLCGLVSMAYALPSADYVSVSSTTITEGDTITITGAVSNGGGYIWTGGALVIWAKQPNGSEISIHSFDSSEFGSGNSKSFAYTPNASGTWKFRASMHGSYYYPPSQQGGAVDSSMTSYKTVGVNPSASGNNPTINSVSSYPPIAYAGDTVTLSANVSDSDGTVSQVEFRINNLVVATDTTAPYTATYTRTTSGNANFSVTVTDNDGLNDNDSIQVAWKPIPPPLPSYMGDRWADVNNDGIWDLIDDSIQTTKDEYDFETYFYGVPDYGDLDAGALVFYDVEVSATYCNYYYLPIYSWISNLVYNPWGLFDQRYSWYGTWYTPFLGSCQYQIDCVKGDFTFHAAEIGYDYQIQTSQSATNPVWTNLGGIITAANTTISRELGEFDGVALLPSLIRIVKIGKSSTSVGGLETGVFLGTGHAETRQSVTAEVVGYSGGEYQLVFNHSTNPYSGGSMVLVAHPKGQSPTIGGIEILGVKIGVTASGQITIVLPSIPGLPGDYGYSIIWVDGPPLQIIPVAGQAGVDGDLIPSVTANGGERHYVTPKVPSGNAEFTLNLEVSNEQFEETFEWEGGTPHQTDPKIRIVSRVAPGHTVLKLKQKRGGDQWDLLNAWVVWANVEQHVLTTEQPLKLQDRTFVSNVSTIVYAIQPISIITGAEIPALKTATPPAALLADPPSVPAGFTHISLAGNDLSPGAFFPWDTSRQIRVKHLDPHNFIPAVEKAHESGDTFPKDDFLLAEGEIIGNDDSLLKVEDDNYPYSPHAPLLGEVDAGTGKLRMFDQPSITIFNSMGSNGDEYRVRLHSYEFVRLHLNGKWYRVSDYIPWRSHISVRKNSGTWDAILGPGETEMKPNHNNW